MDFRTRIETNEIMDVQDLDREVLSTALKDIDRSNRWLGGYRLTRKALGHLTVNHPTIPFSILDVGCGDGAMLRHLANSFRNEERKVELYGLDLNSQTIELARERSLDYPEIKYFCGDVRERDPDIPHCDFVISTLTMHHFGDADIPIFMENSRTYAKKAVVINDLHRSRIAYYLFMIFSAIFIKSSVARNDGLISIRRGFRKLELQNYAEQFPGYEHLIQWKWAFRFVWIMKQNRQKN